MITTYAGMAEYIAGGRSKTRRKVANNTYAEIRDESTIAIKLHDTDVVTYHADGTISLNTGGWLTVTTKDRINTFTPTTISVHSKRGKRNAPSRWHVSFLIWDEAGYARWDRRTDDTSVPYEDGIILTPLDEHTWTALTTIDAAKLTIDDEANAKMNGRITRYSKLYTKEAMEVLVQKAREHGTGGDCWFCSMVTKEGVALGDSTSNHDHLLEHMKDKYVMLSLAINALAYKANGDRDWAQRIILYGMDYRVREAINEYMRSRLYTAGVTVKSGRRPTDMNRVPSTGF